METLLNIARAVRLWIWDVTSMRFFGIEVDVFVHLVLSGVLYAVAERFTGTRRAWQILAVAIVGKEIFDLFLKSALRYITVPTAEAIIDIVVDVLMGLLGGSLVWLWGRLRARRRAPAAS